MVKSRAGRPCHRDRGKRAALVSTAYSGGRAIRVFDPEAQIRRELPLQATEKTEGLELGEDEGEGDAAWRFTSLWLVGAPGEWRLTLAQAKRLRSVAGKELAIAGVGVTTRASDA
ncbi:MAG: hypothetical protein A2Y63_00045 [Candidatus Riflebacteria bacterium RBG_13_59_9]|nr:MAG: hypothetical protein A2Y63_00045 [Candidatus Riflebacteria bacterium RBG_13_59_9]